MFEDLLNEPRFSSVLQFYAAFTGLTNQGVQDVVSGIDLTEKEHIPLTIMRCYFEAEIQDQLLYQEINQRLNGELEIDYVALTPFDCMSVGYFLAFTLRAGELQNITLQNCSIDDHSFCLLLGELSRLNNEAYPASGILQGVTYLDISWNNIGDDGIAQLATALQANTTIKSLHISANFSIAVNGAESLGRALSVNSSLEELDISYTRIGDEGVAHIANALQTNTTLKVMDVLDCGISCKGAESLAKALSVNISLEMLNISDNSIGDNGATHIATALHTSTLKSLWFFNVGTGIVTDKAALSLAAALTVNTSMEVMKLGWKSTNPDTTLKKMAKCIKKSTLRALELAIDTPSQPLCEPQVNLEEAREWLKYVEVGGKQFILSLKDSNLKNFSLTHSNLNSLSMRTPHDLTSQICASLKEAAISVNSTRKMNHRPEIEFSIWI